MRRLCGSKGEALHAEEEEARALKQRLEAMGPVNMMALEEYNETAAAAQFLETQRKDLMDSIENTQASIKEIDDVSRVKFDEAFKVINENFGVTFTKLFGGGQAFMKLTDEENSAESRDRYCGFAAGQEAAEYSAAFGRREGADGTVAAGRHLPVPACAVLRAGRSGCAAG